MNINLSKELAESYILTSEGKFLASFTFTQTGKLYINSDYGFASYTVIAPGNMKHYLCTIKEVAWKKETMQYLKGQNINSTQTAAFIDYVWLYFLEFQNILKEEIQYSELEALKRQQSLF